VVVSQIDERVAAWRAVLLAQDRVVRAIERDLADAGQIPLSWYDVLLELNAAPERCLRMQDLGERVVLSRSRVSRLVDDLERDGLVERNPDPDDGRATLARLTRAGKAALRRAAPVYLRGIDRYFTAHLDDGERATIASALQRVIDAHDNRAHR
jgi:DNA-binding MarR family transcriptional regulator